jgi:hypothetical protein
MVMHMVGANDFANGIPAATYKATVAARVAYLRLGSRIAGPRVHVLMQPYERYDTFTPVAPWADYGKALAGIVAADPDHIAYLDISGHYYLSGVPSSDPLGLLDTDNTHQTDARSALMADLLRQALGVVQLGSVAAPPAPDEPEPTEHPPPRRRGAVGHGRRRAHLGRLRRRRLPERPGSQLQARQPLIRAA